MHDGSQGITSVTPGHPAEAGHPRASFGLADRSKVAGALLTEA